MPYSNTCQTKKGREIESQKRTPGKCTNAINHRIRVDLSNSQFDTDFNLCKIIPEHDRRLVFVSVDHMPLRKTNVCSVLLDERCFSLVTEWFRRRQKYNGLKFLFYDRFLFTLSLSAMKSEKQKMERMHAADLNSKQKQVDDYSKRSVKTLIFFVHNKRRIRSRVMSNLYIYYCIYIKR